MCPFSDLGDGLLSREDEEEFGMSTFIVGIRTLEGIILQRRRRAKNSRTVV